jgi:hypothetical protein
MEYYCCCVCVDQWDVQSIVKRIVAELQYRDYLVWFDRASLAAHASCTQRSAALTERSHTRLTGRCSGADEGLSDGASADATLYCLLVCIELMRVL